MKKTTTFVIAFAFTVTSICSIAAAAPQDSWGSLSGQFIVKGDAPAIPGVPAGQWNEPEPLGDNADKAICMVDGKAPADDGILIGENGGLQNVYVFMYQGRKDDPPIHPSYEAEAKTLTIDNVKCRFVPKAIVVRPGQKVTLKNSDNVGHNCHITTWNNEENINLPANESIDVTFAESDKLPGDVKCDIHKWMDAVIFVRDNPYVAITDADGKFEIKNVPAGDWKFQFWHKEIGYLDMIEIPEKEFGRRKEVELTIPADKALDLGTLELKSEVFAPAK